MFTEATQIQILLKTQIIFLNMDSREAATAPHGYGAARLPAGRPHVPHGPHGTHISTHVHSLQCIPVAQFNMSAFPFGACVVVLALAFLLAWKWPQATCPCPSAEAIAGVGGMYTQHT